MGLTSDPFGWVGRSVARLLARCSIVEADVAPRGVERVRGVAVVIAIALAAWSMVTAFGFVLIVWLAAPRWWTRRNAPPRGIERTEVLIAVELCAVGFHTGANVPQVLELVAPHVPGALGVALLRAGRGYRSGSMLDDELRDIGDAHGDPVARLTAILRAAHVDGDPVAFALERLGDQLRDEQRRAIEVDVRRLSIRLLLPLVCCSLPGFVLIGVVPLVVDALGWRTR